MMQDENGPQRGWQLQDDVPHYDEERWMTADEAAVVREAEETLHDFNVWKATGKLPSPMFSTSKDSEGPDAA
jgi:hypothetical protein